MLLKKSSLVSIGILLAKSQPKTACCLNYSICCTLQLPVKQAALLLRQSSAPQPSTVKSLIRRHTVMRRSTKRSSTQSRKRNPSTSTSGPPTGSLFPSKISPFSFAAQYHRKGSAVSARSAPINKSPKSAGLAQRRQSAFPGFGLQGLYRTQQKYGTIYRVPHHHNPFSTLPAPKHRRSASTNIRQHLLPPLDRPPAPVPPESDLQVCLLDLHRILE